MYKFRDVTETLESTLLPSEALMINGEYIENLVSGYRTLNVSGREALSPVLDYYETGVRDGSVLKSKRYPARTIIVRYQLIAETNEEFREAYNQLAAILDVQEAQLIFADEPDKFFTGTPSAIGEVEPGRNAVTGEFELFCADPFKYSVTEYEATSNLVDGSILIDYEGTYKAFPTLVAEFYNENEASEDGESVTTLSGSGDCGYVAFFNESEKIVQLGDPDEVDTETYAKSQTLCNSVFNKSSSWGNAAKTQWATNEGTTTVSKVGTLGMGVASYAAPKYPASVSSTLLKNAISDADAPKIHYTITAKATERTSSSVRAEITIKTWLHRDSSYFGRGYSLKGSIYIEGKWHDVTLKTDTEYWKGKSGHIATLTVNITGLAADVSGVGGIKFKVTRPDGKGNAGKLGETACGWLNFSQYEAPVAESYYLTAKSYGSGTGWHGSALTRTLPADASGEVGAKNFTFTFSNKFTADLATRGRFEALLTNNSGTIIAGIRIAKDNVLNNANLVFIVNGAVKFNTTLTEATVKKCFAAGKSSSIKKSGQTVTFTSGGYTKSYKDSGITNTAVTKVTFAFGQYKTDYPVNYNGLYNAKFVKDNCDTWADIPNKFSANDVVEADCKNGDVYLNGVLTPALGALGNDYEEFYLTPGLNQIGFSYSDWVADAYKPSFIVRYREVYL